MKTGWMAVGRGASILALVLAGCSGGGAAPTVEPTATEAPTTRDTARPAPVETTGSPATEAPPASDEAECASDAACAFCAHERAPMTTADCACPGCFAPARSVRECAARDEAWRTVCGEIAQRIRCRAPECPGGLEPACVDGRCVEVSTAPAP